MHRPTLWQTYRSLITSDPLLLKPFPLMESLVSLTILKLEKGLHSESFINATDLIEILEFSVTWAFKKVEFSKRYKAMPKLRFHNLYRARDLEHYERTHVLV